MSIWDLHTSNRTKDDGRKEQAYRITLIVIAVVYAILMIIASGERPLVIDEIYQLDFSMHHGFVEVLTLDPYSPPLFTAIAWVWYHIVPYGKTALRVLPIVLAAMTIPMSAGCARTIFGRRAAVMTALLVFLSGSLATHGALNFRQYSLYALLAMWVLYLYLRRVRLIHDEKPVGMRMLITQGVAMALLGYTHYLGLLFCIIIFVFDLLSLFSKKTKGMRLRLLVPYAVAVVLYIPWMAFAIKAFMERIAPAVVHAGDEEALDEYDPLVVRAIGKDADSLTFLKELGFLSGSEHVARIFVLAVLIIVIGVIVRISRKDLKLGATACLIIPPVLVFAMLMPSYCAARFTAITTTFWVNRYFMPLLPCVSITIACAFAQIMAVIPKKGWLHALCAVLALGYIGYYNVHAFVETLDNGNAAMYEPFANYLMSQEDIQDDGTAWLTYSASKNRSREIPTWIEYVFNEDGARDFDIMVIDGNDRSVKKDPDCIRGYDKLYVSMQSNNFHYPKIPDTFQWILDNEYVLVDIYQPYPDTHPKEWVRTYVSADLIDEELR